MNGSLRANSFLEERSMSMNLKMRHKYLNTPTIILVTKVVPKLSIELLLMNFYVTQLVWNLYILTLMLNLCREKL